MRVLKVVKILVCIGAAVLVFGFVTMKLWNWLMPELFGLHQIRFAQAIGLVVLSKILFGGFHRHGGGGWKQERLRRREWKQKMKDRFEHMSPEEKERFKGAMKDRWGGACGPRGWGGACDGFGAKEEETKG